MKNVYWLFQGVSCRTSVYPLILALCTSLCHSKAPQTTYTRATSYAPAFTGAIHCMTFMPNSSLASSSFITNPVLPSFSSTS